METVKRELDLAPISESWWLDFDAKEEVSSLEKLQDLVRIPVLRDGDAKAMRMLELQGNLCSADNEFGGHKIGTLEWIEGKPFFQIGIHRLEGSVVPLDKKLLVLEKREEHFVLEAVVDTKLLFNTRPKLLVRETQIKPDITCSSPTPA